MRRKHGNIVWYESYFKQPGLRGGHPRAPRSVALVQEARSSGAPPVKAVNQLAAVCGAAGGGPVHHHGATWKRGRRLALQRSAVKRYAARLRQHLRQAGAYSGMWQHRRGFMGCRTGEEGPIVVSVVVRFIIVQLVEREGEIGERPRGQRRKRRLGG